MLSGPRAATYTLMGPPLEPKLKKGFATNLKSRKCLKSCLFRNKNFSIFFCIRSWPKNVPRPLPQSKFVRTPLLQTLPSFLNNSMSGRIRSSLSVVSSYPHRILTDTQQACFVRIPIIAQLVYNKKRLAIWNASNIGKIPGAYFRALGPNFLPRDFFSFFFVGSERKLLPSLKPDSFVQLILGPDI